MTEIAAIATPAVATTGVRRGGREQGRPLAAGVGEFSARALLHPRVPAVQSHFSVGVSHERQGEGGHTVNEEKGLMLTNG